MQSGPKRMAFALLGVLALSAVVTDAAAASGGSDAPRVYIYDGSAWLGVAIDPVPDGAPGARVVRVVPGSPAARAGIQAEDILLRIDGHEIRNPGELVRIITSCPVGVEVRLAVRRGKKRLTVAATLTKRPSGISAPRVGPFDSELGPRDAEGGGGDSSRERFLPPEWPYDGVPDIEALFPPGWDAGLDPATRRRLRSLMEEMRRALRDPTYRWLLDGARRDAEREHVKDPFAEAPGSDRAGPEAERPEEKAEKKTGRRRPPPRRMPELVIPPEEPPPPTDGHRARRLRDRHR